MYGLFVVYIVNNNGIMKIFNELKINNMLCNVEIFVEGISCVICLVSLVL